jgi:hypothetical protein
VVAKDSLSSGFYFFGQKVQNIDKNACIQMFQTLEPFRKVVVVDEPSKDSTIAVQKFFSFYKKHQCKESLEDLGIPGMAVEQFWEDGGKDHTLFEYGNPFVKKPKQKLV